MKKRLLTAILVITLAFGALLPGCSPGMARLTAGLIVLGATIAVMAHHDAHYHSHHCGHTYQYRGGRHVYYYQGRWEYYDHHQSRWYYYRD